MPPNEPGIGPAATGRGRAAGRERRGLAMRDCVLPLLRSKRQTHQYGCAGVAGPCRPITRESGRVRFALREPYRPLPQAGSSEALNTWAMPHRGADPAPRHTPRG